MEMQLNKMKIIFKIFILSIFLNSCNGQNQNIIEDKTKKEIKKPSNDEKNFDFLSKYKNNYQLVINESDALDHPFFNFLDCDKNLYFSVHFVPKNNSLMEFWEKLYFQKYKYAYEDMITENNNIRNILKNNFKEYNIFSYKVENGFLNKKNGCTEEGINIKKGGIVDIYLYNQNTKEWSLLKKIKAEIEPAYTNNSFFIDLFPELFSFDKVLKLNENKNIAYFYDYDLDKDGIKDKIILYKNEKETDEFEKNHFGLSMEIKKGLSNSTYQIWCKNNSIIPQNKFNCATEGFNTIVFKDNYFTIENQICSDYIEISSYITFKVVGRDIFLHKYGETYFDKADHEKQIPSKVWKSKNFGDVKFEKVTDAFLIKLSQTIPKK